METTHKVISVVSTKGGVGKTTVTTSLAAYSAAIGKAPLMINTDSQRSLQYFVARRNKTLPKIGFFQWKPEHGHIHEQLDKAVKTNDLVFLDVRGADDPMSRSAALSADLILVPMVVANKDLDVFANETLPLLKDLRRASKKSPRIIVVFNRWHWLSVHHRSTVAEIERIARETGIFEIASTKLPTLIEFDAAGTLGKCAAEYSPKSKAAKLLAALYDETIGKL